MMTDKLVHLFINHRRIDKKDGILFIRSIRNSSTCLIQILLTIILFTLGLRAILNTQLSDFLAFFGSGVRMLSLQSPYGPYPTVYGASVFQSVPWLAWFFVPFALLPSVQAFQIFVIINSALLLLTIILISSAEKVKFSPLNFAYIYASGLAISYNCLAFGQVTVIQLAALCILIVALQRENDTLAGILIPILLIKPHLIIWFLIYLLLITNKRRFIVSSLYSTLIVSAVALAIQPSWPVEMIKTILVGQSGSTMESWKFSTFTGLLALKPLYGLLVLPVSIPVLIWLRRKIKLFPISSQLAIALAFSLATSPYAFAYDLPLLIPSMIWLSRKWSLGIAIVWLLMALFSVISGFSGTSYLVTLSTCALIVAKLVILSSKHAYFWSWEKIRNSLIPKTFKTARTSTPQPDIE